MNEFVNGKAQQPLPTPLAPHEAQIGEFVSQCHALCLRILQLVAIGLEIDPSAGGKEWFSSYHDRKSGASGSVFRLLYYPKLHSSTMSYDAEKDIRAGAHSDYGTITLLFQREGQPGLEILTDTEKKTWYPVPVNPTSEDTLPILVNVGDLLSYWTNGALKSAVHRVTFPEDSIGGDRYSIAYFCHPLDEARLEAVPSKKLRNRGKAEGQTLTAKQHLESRLAATYG
jgi:isopenicillin N synthase-like dioxygenase